MTKSTFQPKLFLAKTCKQIQTDANRCKQMQTDAIQMQLDAKIVSKFPDAIRYKFLHLFAYFSGFYFYRCKKMHKKFRCNQMQIDLNRCKQMQIDIKRCKQMQKH